jgi:mono/diheme cytochrome c family protein
MRSGVGRHGEDLYPALPYTSYALLSSDDVLAIRAYPATLAPVATPAPANALAFPFNQRYIMRGWKLLFLVSKPFEPDPARGVAWNRGAYLVNGLAHCSECHTPRNLMFAGKQDEALSGGVVDGWKAWDITPDEETGIGAWTDAQLVSYLSTGYAPGHGAASGSMRQAIDLSLSQLPATDIEAIVTYLRTVTPRRADAAAAVVPVSAAVKASTAWSPGGEASDGTGRRIFEGACASCHGWNGNGQQTARAGLAGSHAVNDPHAANLIRVILEAPAVRTMPRQPPCRRSARPTLMPKSPRSQTMPSSILAESRGRLWQRTSRMPGPKDVRSTRSNVTAPRHTREPNAGSWPRPVAGRLQVSG